MLSNTSHLHKVVIFHPATLWQKKISEDVSKKANMLTSTINDISESGLQIANSVSRILALSLQFRLSVCPFARRDISPFLDNLMVKITKIIYFLNV